MELKNMKFIDLFAGIGGFRYALESLGCTCVFSSEWDKFCKMMPKYPTMQGTVFTCLKQRIC